MKPPKRDTKNYEKVSTEGFVPGIIEEVIYDKEHTFKGFEGKPDTQEFGVRLKFTLDGCKFPHYSKWMRFNYGEKANLYKKVLVPLVEGIKPDQTDFDLDQIKGMKVNTLWVDNDEFQNLETIRPIGKKIVPLNIAPGKIEPAEVHEVATDEEVPF